MPRDIADAHRESAFGRVLDAIVEVKRNRDLRLCACLGLLSAEQARRLKDAGANTVNHNLNTSENFHPEICTTHTFADREATLRNVKQAGLSACSGGIIGMGESDDDIIDLAVSLRALKVDSAPVNFLIPIEGTPLAGLNDFTPTRCLRVLCLFRFHPAVAENSHRREDAKFTCARFSHSDSIRPTPFSSATI